MREARLNSYVPDYRLFTLVLIGALLVFRLVTLYFSPLNLHGDEAQYWNWAQDLDWGYFSKPPMIAWVIWASTSVFGDAEWAVRLSSPILHSVTAFVVFCLGRKLFDARIGFWSAALYLTMPAVWLSNGIVSTDVPLLLCWATAMLAWAHLRQRVSWRWALTFGAAFGLGVLSKYAMLFMVPALLVLAVIDKPTRRAFASFKGLGAVIIAALVMLPNIIWNAQNEFATLSHTAANANIQDDIFHPMELLEFWGSQFGVFGPLTLVLLIYALLRAGKTTKAPGTQNSTDAPRRAVLLIPFVAAPLLIISAEALLARANANWAVTAYMGGSVLTAYMVLSLGQRIAKSAIGINIVLGLVMVVLALSPALTNLLGQANAFKRMRGWPETAAAIAPYIEAGNFDYVSTDNRLVFYDLAYYREADAPPLRMWLNTVNVNNHAEYTKALPANSGRVLLINYYEDYEAKFREDFKTLTPLAPIDLDLGGGKRRVLKVWAAEGYTPTTARTE